MIAVPQSRSKAKCFKRASDRSRGRDRRAGGGGGGEGRERVCDKSKNIGLMYVKRPNPDKRLKKLFVLFF